MPVGSTHGIPTFVQKPAPCRGPSAPPARKPLSVQPPKRRVPKCCQRRARCAALRRCSWRACCRSRAPSPSPTRQGPPHALPRSEPEVEVRGSCLSLTPTGWLRAGQGAPAPRRRKREPGPLSQRRLRTCCLCRQDSSSCGGATHSARRGAGGASGGRGTTGAAASRNAGGGGHKDLP